jgi:phage-related protein
LVNAARELLARHLEAANDGEAHSDAEPSQQTRTTQPRRL